MFKLIIEIAYEEVVFVFRDAHQAAGCLEVLSQAYVGDDASFKIWVEYEKGVNRDELVAQ